MINIFHGFLLWGLCVEEEEEGCWFLRVKVSLFTCTEVQALLRAGAGLLFVYSLHLCKQCPHLYAGLCCSLWKCEIQQQRKGTGTGQMLL